VGATTGNNKKAQVNGLLDWLISILFFQFRWVATVTTQTVWQLVLIEKKICTEYIKRFLLYQNNVTKSI